MTEQYETTKRLLVNIYSETSTKLFTITFYSLFELRLTVIIRLTVTVSTVDLDLDFEFD